MLTTHPGAAQAPWPIWMTSTLPTRSRSTRSPTAGGERWPIDPMGGVPHGDTTRLARGVQPQVVYSHVRIRSRKGLSGWAAELTAQKRRGILIPLSLGSTRLTCTPL